MGRGALFVRFATAGLTVAVVQLGLLLSLEMAGVYYLYASTLSFCVGIVLNFVLQKYWSFRSSGNTERQFVFFIGNSLVNLAANAALMFIFVELFFVITLLAQVMSIAILMVYNFIVYSFLFKRV